MWRLGAVVTVRHDILISMKFCVPFLIFVGACCVVSCDSRNSGGGSGSGEISKKWKEDDFTPWMSRAELQVMQENHPEGQYFTYVEGRVNGGLAEYRAVSKAFESDLYSHWAVFWGLDENELFQQELKLLNAGFAKKERQVFLDSTGKALHQMVWIRHRNDTVEPDPPRSSPVSSLSFLESDDGAKTVESTSEVEQAAKEPAPLIPVEEAKDLEISTPASSPEDVPQPAEAGDAPVQQPVIEAEPPAAEPVMQDEDVSEAMPEAATDIHVVRAGDTLGKIARERKTTVGEIQSLNGLKSDLLRVGQKLKVPVKE